MLSENYEIFHYKDSYLKDVALHHHDFFELYFFISGDVSYTIESRNYKLHPGDILLISPQELHQPIIDQKKPYERIVLWINCNYLKKLSTEKSDLTRCFDSDLKDRTNLLRLDPENLKAVRTQFVELLAETNNQKPYSDLICHCLLVQLVAELNRQFINYTGHFETETSLGGVMNDIVNYINKHHTESLSLDFLSQEFYISKYHMSREFMRHFGISIHKYITKKRLITAKQLLSDGIAPSEVCTKCGFSDYANFYRAFRSEYGISPRDFVEYIRVRDDTSL
ncbi:MAG: AraC family transcriptional regulator [Eubacteriales bacterium]|jgi:AraC-like DNA-binding protein